MNLPIVPKWKWLDAFRLPFSSNMQPTVTRFGGYPTCYKESTSGAAQQDYI